MGGQDHFELSHLSQLCQMLWMSHMVLKRLNRVLRPPNLCFVLSCLCWIAGSFWFFLYSAHVICMRKELIWVLLVLIISILFFLWASSLDLVIDFCRLSNNNKRFQPVSTVLYSKWTDPNVDRQSLHIQMFDLQKIGGSKEQSDLEFWRGATNSNEIKNGMVFCSKQEPLFYDKMSSSLLGWTLKENLSTIESCGVWRMHCSLLIL